MSSFFANLPRVVKNLEKLDEKFHLSHYKWDHNTVVSPLSMARCPYPTSNLPTAKWLLKVAERVVEVILNTKEVDILGDKATNAQLIRNAQLLKGQVEREAVNLTTLTRVVGDIVQYGRVTAGGGGRPKDMEEYAQLFKVIVYTSSVQHAAVNFPQYDLMSYCPNMPLAAFSQFPKTAGGNPVPAQAQDYLNILPPMGTALTQVNVGFTLGSIHYTELGDYENGQFSQPVTNGPLAAFKTDLQSIGETIRTRNTNRRPYTPLLPEGIPQSINI
ncbi:MAG TPA: lipoxygenase family protein [Flavilitoribacter sp.]|nr:lipoxygenase family protein [Flavilitoribacter sp.]HMQ86398.1 lipoxygenase family protein [Flavilitoribacter sp.]